MKINPTIVQTEIKNAKFEQFLTTLGHYLYFFCLLALLMCVVPASAQSDKVTINRTNVPLKTVFADIEQQTSYLFFYEDNKVNVNRKVTVHATGKSLSSVLKTILTKNNISYKIRNRYIVLNDAKLPAASKGATGNGNAVGNNRRHLITGHIVDKNDEPLVGVAVQVDGDNRGAVTDMDGNFSIEAAPGETLTASYIGFTPQKISVGKKTQVALTLHENAEELNEVVVIGYGTIKKKDLTGAISGVKGDNIAVRHTSQLSTALQGAVAGLTVTRNNSAPGSTATLKIRGVTTISDTSPLVIIDGVPGDINQVNPDDVENISVLKDAASASIYGSRAAAGVILVTTKRAKNDVYQLSYNFEYGVEIPTELPKYVKAKQFLEMVNETRYNDNPAGGWYQTYTEDQVNNWDELHKTDPDTYPDEDWQDAILKTSAPRQTHSLTLSGGSKKIRSKASFRYDKQEALYDVRNYERFQIRVNNDIDINKYFHGIVDFTFRRARSVQPNVNPLSIEARTIPPIYAIKWTNGMWGDVKDGGNVLATLHEGGTDRSWNQRLSGKAEIDFTPVKGLKISGVIAPTFNNDKGKMFRKKVPYTYANNAEEIKGYMAGFLTSKLSESRNDSHNLTTQLFANYDNTFGKHTIGAMIGYEDYYAFWENLGASRDQYTLTNFPYLNQGPEDFRDNSGSAQEYAYHSFMGRIMYNYDNRYLFQANMRRDGSSRFAKQYRWGNFPSFSAGWVASEEPFFKKLNVKWLDFLKFRASWGKLGNERIGSYYPYQATMNFGFALFQDGTDVMSETTASQQYYAVTNITWETTTTWDLGLDARFLNDRLRFTFDYYRKNTKDMLLSLEIPKYIGFDNPEDNAGKMHTTGFDLELGWYDHVGDFRYSAAFNLSDYTSKMGDLKGTQFLGDQVKFQGSEFNEWYGYLSDGLFQTQEDVDNSPKLNNNTKVGDVKYKDISGPDGVPDGKISSEYDRVLLGGSQPHFMFGGIFNAAWKGFDFSMTIQGVAKQKARITSTMASGLYNNFLGFPELIVGKYWSAKNTDEQNLAAEYPRLTRSNQNANFAMSDYWLFNGHYLRLKNVSIGYTIPKSLTEKIRIQSLRFYVSGTDLLSLDNYPHGWDPEVSTTSYPITTSLVFGVNVNF